jgi:HAD superfamily hydrolase (TIGR01490 family)
MNAPSPSIGNIAAFFDLDGTLLPEPSLERRFFHELRRGGAMPLLNYLQWAVETLHLLPGGLVAVTQRNKRYLTGLSCDLALRFLDSISFFEEGLARFAWHVQQGHEIVLISGTIEPLAQLAAMALECELEARNLQAHPKVLATKLSEARGRWTGYIVGEAMFGPVKARAASRFAEESHLDLNNCYAYGDSFLDRHLLSVVGHAHAVNPGKRIAALANEKDWPIWHWFQEKHVAPAEAPVITAVIPPQEEQV